jgi:hypothetical protein
MLGRLPAAALALCAASALCAWTACSDDKHGDKASAKGATAKTAPATAPDLGARCQPLATACGDTDKHIAKILEECTATAEQAEHRCAAEALAVFDCYEKDLCGKGDKVWSLDDLRVLAERHGACATQREALRGCAAK